MMNKKTLVLAGVTVGVVGVGAIAYKLFKLNKLRNDNDKKLDDILDITNNTDALFCCLQSTAYDEKTPEEIHTLIREKCDEMLTNIKMFKISNNGTTYESDSSANYYNDTKALVEELIAKYNSLFSDLSSRISSPEDGHILDKYIDFYNVFYEKLNDLIGEISLAELERDCMM